MELVTNVPLPSIASDTLRTAVLTLENGGSRAERLADRIVEQTLIWRRNITGTTKRGIAFAARGKHGRVKTTFADAVPDTSPRKIFVLEDEPHRSPQAAVMVCAVGGRYELHTRRRTPAARGTHQLTSTRWTWSAERTEIIQRYQFFAGHAPGDRLPEKTEIHASGTARFVTTGSDFIRFTSEGETAGDREWCLLLLGEQLGCPDLLAEIEDDADPQPLLRRIFDAEHRIEAHLLVKRNTLFPHLVSLQEALRQKFPDHCRELALP